MSVPMNFWILFFIFQALAAYKNCSDGLTFFICHKSDFSAVLFFYEEG